MEDWKNKVINSLDGIERAEPRKDVFLKIQAKIHGQKSQSRQWIAIAATISMVVCANVYLLLNYNSTTSPTVDKTEYQSLVTNYNIYGNE